MNETSLSHPASDDQVLAELIERLTERLANGEELSIDSIVVEYPLHAGRLCAIWPALYTLVEIGNAAPQNASALGTLGDFRLIRELGRGGMGIVYEAEQVSLGRRVALKTLPFAGTLDERVLARFRNEALAAGALHHPHVVPIYGVGCERGIHFLAMQFIDGISLDRAIASIAATSSTDAELTSCDTVPLALRSTERIGGQVERFSAVARLAADAADALHYAHERGVIHRDIKPANLLVDRHGAVWITDFGLARVEGAENLTLTGDLVGTWRYLSPEQAAGNRLGVDHRTDIYSLGATLYELLTLHPVMDGTGRERLLQQVLTAEPPALRSLDSRIPLELETITHKALAKDPADRYATAGEFAADLRRFLERRPIRARPVSFLHRSRAWARRHAGWLLSAAISLSVVALLVLLAANVALQAERRTRRALVQSNDNLQLARDREQELRVKLYAGDLPAAQRALEAGDSKSAKAILARHVPTATDKDDRRGFEWHYLWQLCHRQPTTVKGHSVNVTAAEFSSDGRLLATGDRKGVLKFWRLPGLQAAGDISAHTGEIRGIYFHSPSGQFVTVGNEGTIRGWNPESLANDWKIRRADMQFTASALSDDETILAVAGDDYVVRCWSLATRELVHTLPALQSRIAHLEFCPGKELMLYAGEARGPIHGWRVATGETLHEPLVINQPLSALQISHDGALLLTGSLDSTARLFDLPSGTHRSYTHIHDGPVLGADIMPGRMAMVSSGNEPSVRLWDFPWSQRHLRYRRTLMQTDEDICCLNFSRDGQYLLLADTDGMLRLLQAEDLQDGVQYLPLQPDAAYRPQEWEFSRDGRLLARCSNQGQLEIFDVATGRQLASVPTGLRTISGLCLSPDSHWLVVSCMHEGATLWNLSNPVTLVRQSEFVSPLGVERCCAFSPSGRFLALSTATQILIWDTKQRGIAHRFPMKNVVAAQISIDEKLLVASARSGELTVWSLENDLLLSKSKSTARSAGPLCILPNGKHVVRGTSTGFEVFTLPDLAAQPPTYVHGPSVHSLCFSPDGKTLVTGAAQNLLLWNVATWQQAAHFPPLEHEVTEVAFSMDGRSLLTAGGLPGKIGVLTLQPAAAVPAGE